MNSNAFKPRFCARLGQLALGLSMLGLAGYASAQTQVDDAWVRATVPGQPSTGAFMTITASSDGKLISAQSPVAKTVQIHQSSMKNDVMSMQQVESVDLPAGKAVAFNTDSYHVMLMDLVGQVKEGDKVPLVLTVEHANGEKEVINVDAPARALNMMDHSKMDHSKMH